MTLASETKTATSAEPIVAIFYLPWITGIIVIESARIKKNGGEWKPFSKKSRSLCCPLLRLRDRAWNLTSHPSQRVAHAIREPADGVSSSMCRGVVEELVGGKELLTDRQERQSGL
jgi:hypothetical protein